MDSESAKAVPKRMGEAWLIGYEVGARGWEGLVPLDFDQPGVADAYWMGVKAGQKDKGCITTNGGAA